MSAVVFQFQASGQKDVENAFKAISSAAEKSSKSVIKETDQQAKALGKLAKSVDKTSKEIEKTRLQASNRATSQIIADYERQAKAAEKLAERMDKAFAKVKPNKNGVGLIGQVAAGFVGGSLVTSAVRMAIDGIGAVARGALKIDELANRVAINGRMAGEKMPDKNAIRGAAYATAIANPGISTEDVLNGSLAFQAKTGRLDIAQQMQGSWATLASASSSKLEDIAKASADLFEKFDIKTVKEMEEALAKLYFQGKEGAFELKDAADQYARLAGAASRFNFGKGAVAVATLGGLTQIAKRTTGSPEEASTSVERMLSNITEHANKLSGYGVKVFDKQGRTNNIQDILVDMISKVGGNNLAQKKIKLGELLGERGIRAATPLMQIYEDTYLKAKGSKMSDKDAMLEGIKALRAEFDKTINAAGKWSDVQTDAAAGQATASATLQQAWDKVQSAASENLTPALIKLAGDIDRFIPGINLVIAAFGTLAQSIGFLTSLLPRGNELHSIQETKARRTNQANSIQKAINNRLASPEHQEYDLDNDPVLNRLYKKQDDFDYVNASSWLDAGEMKDRIKNIIKKSRGPIQPGDRNDYEFNDEGLARQAVDSFMKNHKTGDIAGFGNLPPEVQELFESQRDIYADQSASLQASVDAHERLSEAADDSAQKIANLGTAAEIAMEYVRNLPLSDRY